MQITKCSNYIKPHLRYFIITPILIILQIVGDILIPVKFRDIIDVGVANQDISYILATGVDMLLIIAMMLVCAVGAAYFATKAATLFAGDLREGLFYHIQDLSFSSIDKFSTGSLITRSINDVSKIQTVVSLTLRQAFRAPGMLIGSVVMALSLNARLAVILFIVIVLLVIIISIILKSAIPRFSRLQISIDNMNTRLQESLINIRVTKSFVRSDTEQEKFEDTNEKLEKSSMQALKLVIIQMPIMTLIMNLCTVAIVWYGGKSIIAGDIQIGVLVAITTYIVQILNSMLSLSNLLLQFSRASTCVSRINEVFAVNSEISQNQHADDTIQISKGTIEFKNVTFRYYKNSCEPVLDNINLKILEGQTVGIIGPIGCGKSTLLALIPRLYEVDEGEVLIDGVNIKNYRLSNLRNKIGVVLQNNILFSGTISENLRWGKPAALQSEVKEAAKNSEALTFIESMEHGMNHTLNQGGVNLSGGQKQRLCIARAIIRKPKILIFDDSTSAVDMATEQLIYKKLSKTAQKITTLIISQRITCIKNADVIFVMDNGKIIASGKHNNLLESCLTYKEIYDSQNSERD